MVLVAGDCPSCSHPWALHPVACDVRVCAECIYEEDHDDRETDQMCDQIAPAFDRPAAQFVSTRTGRDILGRRTILLVDNDGETWRSVRGGGWASDRALRRLRALEVELAAASLRDFWRSHQGMLR